MIEVLQEEGSIFDKGFIDQVIKLIKRFLTDVHFEESYIFDKVFFTWFIKKRAILGRWLYIC